MIIRYDGQRVDLPANSTSYTWTVSPHSDGCFAIGAYNAAGWSSDPFPPSQGQDWVCGQTPDLSPPTPPTNLTAAPDGPYVATVHWTNTAAEATEFGVLVMDAQQNAIKQTTVAGHSTNDYTVSIDVPPVLENPVTFCFKASAHNVVSGWSVWSNTACAMLPAVPAAASGLHATVDGQLRDRDLLRRNHARRGGTPTAGQLHVARLGRSGPGDPVLLQRRRRQLRRIRTVRTTGLRHHGPGRLNGKHRGRQPLP